jgi:hypothetical protein
MAGQVAVLAALALALAVQRQSDLEQQVSP